MNNKFLTLVVIGAAVSGGTYFGLNMVKPYHKEEPPAPVTVSVDQVFSGGLKTPDEQPAAAQPATEGQPAAATAATTEPAKPADLAADRPGEGASAATPASEPAAAPAPTAEATPAANPAPAQEDRAELAAPAKPTPAPKKAAEPKPTQQPVETAASSSPAPAKKAAPPAPAAAWWGKEDPNSLSVTFAGSASDQKAVAVLFNGPFDDASAAAGSLKLQDSKGAAVPGNWQVSPKNKRMLMFPVKISGTYALSIKHGLKDSKGLELAKDLHGPVQVK